MDDALIDPAIVDHYQRRYDESQRITAGLGELELLRTKELIERNLGPPPARIIDIGGGTGVHAQWLAAAGYDVDVVDPVPRHVEAIGTIATRWRTIDAHLGDARRLDFADRTFDAALVLGPLYHLTERDDRVRALREAGRVVVDGAPIFVAAVSRFASLFDGLTRQYLFDPEFRAIVERDLADGQHRNPSRRPHWFTTAFFHHSDELIAEAVDAGLRVRGVFGVEGFAAWQPALEARWSEPDARNAIMAAARAVESEPTLLGLSPHLLLVGTRA